MHKRIRQPRNHRSARARVQVVPAKAQVVPAHLAKDPAGQVRVPVELPAVPVEVLAVLVKVPDPVSTRGLWCRPAKIKAYSVRERRRPPYL